MDWWRKHVFLLYRYMEIDDELFTFRTFVWCINLQGVINRVMVWDGNGEDGARPELIFRSSILQSARRFKLFPHI